MIAANAMPRTVDSEKVRDARAFEIAVSNRRMLLDTANGQRKPAASPSHFASFLQGGFECSTHRRRDGRRLDLIAATGHDEHAASDYSQLARHGMHTVRDGLRWHLIEANTQSYDWSSFLPMLRAAQSRGTQVVWDLMHYGWPDHLDIWTPRFVDRFAQFAAAVARVVRDETEQVPFFCPINEISFHAWGGGDVAYLNPHAHGRGFELKAQLARASIAAMHEILGVDPRARFVHCEPAIHIAADPDRPHQHPDAEAARLAQFQAFDMIAGRLWPQLGGEEKLLDVVGLNYYHQNQWLYEGGTLLPGNPQHKPFRYFLMETYARYGRPLLVAETGTEGDGRAAWFAGIVTETEAARAAGVPVEGICLYPIIDHIGWDDDRNCPSGLLSTHVVNGRRLVHAPLAAAIERIRKRGAAEARGSS